MGNPVTWINSTRNPLNDLIFVHPAIDCTYSAGTAVVAAAQKIWAELLKEIALQSEWMSDRKDLKQ